MRHRLKRLDTKWTYAFGISVTVNVITKVAVLCYVSINNLSSNNLSSNQINNTITPSIFFVYNILFNILALLWTNFNYSFYKKDVVLFKFLK